MLAGSWIMLPLLGALSWHTLIIEGTTMPAT